ncbi:Aquaporin-9 [Amphibalanus amphitrite]|uniref:Aquaporin-9 n=1 Tax=Amphibalanus amphitrite TaxID=1232801 RepID=A0A6A4WWG8_AMPAM|nr:Aquaporin-9 [Amphibalanus amphitrite]
MCSQFFGDAAIANNMILGGTTATVVNVPLGYATALALAVYVSGGVSGTAQRCPQAMGTAMLLFGIMAVTDRRNMEVPKGGVGAAIGLVLFGVITASGSNTGAALNPARDFSPRLYSYIIGYDNVFKAGDHFFWIPLVACYVGAFIGAYLYFFCIEVHHPDELEETPAGLELQMTPADVK